MTVAIFLLWPVCIALLLGVHWPVSHPRKWDRVVWLYVLSGPLSPLYHLSMNLLWAYRSRWLHPAPEPAQWISDGSTAPWRDDTARHVKDGTYLVRAECGRRFEVQFIKSSWCWWYGKVRAVDEAYVRDCLGNDRIGVREYRSITVRDMYDGTFLPYTPPELAPILQRVRR